MTSVRRMWKMPQLRRCLARQFPKGGCKERIGGTTRPKDVLFWIQNTRRRISTSKKLSGLSFAGKHAERRSKGGADAVEDESAGAAHIVVIRGQPRIERGKARIAVVTEQIGRLQA
jgi:hypothetical protein